MCRAPGAVGTRSLSATIDAGRADCLRQQRHDALQPQPVDDVDHARTLALAGDDHMLRVDVAGQLILEREADDRERLSAGVGGSGRQSVRMLGAGTIAITRSARGRSA
jgi:hypothetical protein